MPVMGSRLYNGDGALMWRVIWYSGHDLEGLRDSA